MQKIQNSCVVRFVVLQSCSANLNCRVACHGVLRCRAMSCETPLNIAYYVDQVIEIVTSSAAAIRLIMTPWTRGLTHDERASSTFVQTSHFGPLSAC